jgi:hypothetical protein
MVSNEIILAQSDVCVTDSVKQCSSTGDTRIHLFPGFGGVIYSNEDGRHVLFNVMVSGKEYRVTEEHYDCRPNTQIRCNRFVTIEVKDIVANVDLVRIIFSSDMLSGTVCVQERIGSKRCFQNVSLLSAERPVPDLLLASGLRIGLSDGDNRVRIVPLNTVIFVQSIPYSCFGYANIYITSPTDIVASSTGICVGKPITVLPMLECPFCENTKIV